MVVNAKLTFDGHTWVDRGDGVFIPDQEYEVNDGFCLGPECEGKTFLTKEAENGKRILVALVLGMQSWGAMWKLQDELNEQGERVVSTEGWNPSRIGGLTYVIQK